MKMSINLKASKIASIPLFVLPLVGYCLKDFGGKPGAPIPIDVKNGVIGPNKSIEIPFDFTLKRPYTISCKAEILNKKQKDIKTFMIASAQSWDGVVYVDGVACAYKNGCVLSYKKSFDLVEFPKVVAPGYLYIINYDNSFSIKISMCSAKTV